MSTQQSTKSSRRLNIVKVNDKSIVLNQQGYLIDFNAWTKDVAVALALHDNLKLTDRHWETIEFLRDYYHEFEAPPSIRVIKKALNGSIKANGGKQFLTQHFPLGGGLHACRLAGLPGYYGYAC
jgi:tRNA 2-thiouridine synthesizing protein E